MRKPLRAALVVAATGALIIAGTAILLKPRAEVKSGVAPALPKQVLVKPQVSIAALRGKPALVNFWASWCDPCRREATALQRFDRRLDGRARLVGVDWNDSAAGARSFITHFGWTFPNLRDANGLVGTAYGISGLPTTVVLNARGRIASVLRGPQTTATLTRAVATLTGS